MKIKPELKNQINKFRYAMKDSHECDFKKVPAPCLYFEAHSGKGKAMRASCANCRAERMVGVDDHNLEVDCYTLMIIDFLKTLGVEVEDES